MECNHYMPNVLKTWAWTKQKREAARQLVNDVQITEIAQQLKTTPMTIYRWRQVPEFQTFMAQLEAQWRDEALNKGLGVRERRLQRLYLIEQKIMDVIDARAKELGRLIGGSTGLIVAETKIIGSGDNAVMIEVEQADTGLLREYRALLAQIADETGQSTTRTELSGPGGAPIKLSVSALDDIIKTVQQEKQKQIESRSTDDIIDAEYEESGTDTGGAESTS